MKSANAVRTYWHAMESPVGRLLLAGDGERLEVVHFQSGARPRSVPATWIEDDAPFRSTILQLGEYFEGGRREFDLALGLIGTAFQVSVWQALMRIPYGRTVSYAELAEVIGRSRASRAVGAANGANPIPIIVPCHRVIGTNGSLTGFGGGVDIKRRLLALEQRTRDPLVLEHCNGNPLTPERSSNAC